MSSPLRVACFGAGNVTQNRHIPAMRRHGGFEIVAIVDRRPGRAEEAASRLGIPIHAVAEGVGELDFADRIDAITCGAAPFAHHAIVRSALEAGKHAITEKPFTMTVPEGEELAGMASERGLALCVVHNFQFASSVRRVRRWAERGVLGETRGVWGFQLSNPARALPDWYDELPLGLFYDESPHLIYLVRALAGAEFETRSVTVHPSNRGLVNTPSQVDAQFSAGGVPVTLTMNFEAPVSEWQVALIGERSLAVVDLFRDIAVRIPNDRGHQSLDVLRTSASAGWHHWLGYLRSGPGHLRRRLLYGNDEVFRRFHDAASGGPPAEGIGAGDALAVLRLQHAILAGA